MTTVLFDRTVGKSLPQDCKLLGLDVEAHRDHFNYDTVDEVWLAEVAKRGWVVVTNDKNIRHNEAERRALLENSVGCFMFGKGGRTRFQYMSALVRSWDEIQRIAATETRPFIYVLHADGKLERLHPSPEPKPPRRRRGTRDRAQPDAAV